MTSPQRRRDNASRSTPRLTRAERKRQLLAHAKALFVTLGYRAATTEQIAQAAGVSEQILSRHFANKNAFFLEILEEIRAATLERWRDEIAALGDPLAKLHTVADRYLGSTREHVVEYRILHRTLVESDDEEIVALLRSFYLDSEALLAAIIAEGQQVGVFRRSLDPRVGAWEMIRAALGYTLTLPLDVPLFNEDNYIPQAIDCLLHCLLKTDV